MKKICLILFIFMLSSCFSRKTNYYMLNFNDSVSDNAVMCQLPNNFIIQVGPIEILDYLKRDQVIIKEGENKIKISDRDLWITSLDNQIKSILKLGLSNYITYEDESSSVSADICEYPCLSRDGKERIKITLTVNSFEYDDNLKEVLFNANAKLYFNKNFVDSDTYSYNEALESSSYDDIAKGMSKALEALVKDVAKLICKNN